ncbi:type IVB secretion system protein IcmH/DotU [Cognatiyoonia sp. IB215446]|uniref:type IVB secretion system protein IcmH/DotU n=1 Tax=Cognatiyoonia sp. IB215446 TaxID=3097355 RepID=UPI002A11CF07|nr:type IVB secretion system protein IcmH/DotU [Cognatiyoonia sp. IB215446]MDX8346871.1 type IVB secretion system protein IcmH/DotU [Cognatiyoonia sp. IB215446]
MNRDDPFAEPSDTDKTVIRPNPAGRRTAPQVATPAASPSPAPAGVVPKAQAGPDVAIGTVATGLNPLNAAASSLFLLVGRIRNRAQHGNPGQLRESVVTQIRSFENKALQAGVPAQSVKIARYAICATIDDVVLNTPWGGQSIWAQQSMVGTFHKETHGGDRFFDLLEHLEKEPAQNRDLLEFLYMCLSLGFEGRLRVENRGPEKHLSIRDGLARLIRAHRGPVERDLAPRWKGIAVAHRPVSAWMTIWLITGLTVGAVSLAFFGFSLALSSDTERLRGQLSALNFGGPIELARVAPPPPPPPPTPQQVQEVVKVETFLAPEIEQGLVDVIDQGNVLTVRVAGNGLFGSGSDVLEPDFVPVIDRIAAALNDESGRIIVAGHSDNIPINTARFPSNLFLSLARATSVMDKISRSLDDPGRISAEGRADAEPIARNDTPEGRAQNRRIEVILVKAG